MTYKELKDEVLALGFVDTLESEKLLMLAANRALRLLANDFPRAETLCLYRESQTPIRTKDLLDSQGISLCAGECVAFCYRVLDGEVRFGEKPLPLEKSGVYRFRASCDGVLMPVGDAEVFALAVYGEGVPLVYCESALPFVCYDIDAYATDALRLCRVPTDAFGAEITEARIEGRRILLPRSFSGAFFIHYERCARPMTQRDDEIDLPRECVSLFPLLVCGYLWLDDEPDRAQYYMALYREGRSMLRERKPSRTQRLNTDSLGWT